MAKSIFYKQRQLVAYYKKAGYSRLQIRKIDRFLLYFSIFLAVVAAFVLYFMYLFDKHPRYIFSILFLTLTLGFFVLLFFVFSSFYAFLDFRIYMRKVEAEKLLPEFLILTSSNMRAGMLIDQAIMYSLRSNFGVLAKEMEDVMKEVMSGKDLSSALRDFSERYDSVLIKRTFDIIVEGIESGGKMAGILNRLGVSLSEMELQKKEMSASVTTYVIFIGFASIGAAPVLMALSRTLLGIIKGLMTTLSAGDMGSSSGGGMNFFSITTPTLTNFEFNIFAIVMLSVTSIFSALIIASIRKGDLIRGLKYIPFFIIVSLVLFFVAGLVMDALFGGMFI